MYDFVPHSARTYRANSDRKVGMLTRGNSRASGSRDNRSTLLETDDASFAPFGGVHYELREGRFGSGRLGDRIPVVPVHRPFRDTPDEPRLRAARKTYVCPGCGIVPPRSGRCDQCWD